MSDKSHVSLPLCEGGEYEIHSWNGIISVLAIGHDHETQTTRNASLIISPKFISELIAVQAKTEGGLAGIVGIL